MADVRVVQDPVRMRVLVYVVLGPGANGGRIYDVMNGEPELVEPGAEPPLYMAVDWQIAGAIGEALAPRPEASARHLDDAIAVRDRMTAMLERVVARGLA